ncbi:coiled-coil domain-containing protein 201 [Cyrtonyx montezumae]|uniref:coiled-coil domain-containing protein 201 n=1 Tax=Cyrtonyx montezumae TaxID=9017 RepID=UPI0032DBB999
MDSKPVFQMSEEEDSVPNVKRYLKKKLVKHSTPVDTVFSRKMLPFTGPIDWSVKNQDLSKRAYISLASKSTLQRSVTQVSLASVEAYFPYVSPRRFSTVFDLQDSNREISQSSRVVSSRRQLSTVLASDDSGAEPSEKAVSSLETQTPTKASEKFAINPKNRSPRMVTGIPGIKYPPMLKKKIDKAIVRKKQREWVLQQLKNIEEATKHELTIEEA